MLVEEMAAASRRADCKGLEVRGMVCSIFGKKDLVEMSAQILETEIQDLQYVAKRGLPYRAVRSDIVIQQAIDSPVLLYSFHK